MNRFILITFSLFVLTSYSCSQTKTIKFNEDILKEYPADPEIFMQKYGGIIQYLAADNKVIEKTANVNKAWIKGDGFEVFFWKNSDYYIHHIKFDKNIIKIQGVAVIAQKPDFIIKTFGQPTKISENALIYNQGEQTLTLSIKNGVVSKCYLGNQM